MSMPRPSSSVQPVPLVLGGHSFISQLGSDPPADDDTQTAVVAACLDRGLCWIDTTYQPERVALGRVLQRLGRRGEARVIAWNFFHPFGPGEDVGGPRAYEPHHLQQMCDELRTDRLDALVVHSMGDPAVDVGQLELALSWRETGRVGELGIWAPGRDVERVLGRDNPYAFMVHPRNLTTPNADAVFEAGRRLGWRTCACSPFVRGWKLDEIARRTDADARQRLADHMLRHALFHPAVDQLIVAMRRPQWVAANLASVVRGRLSPDEQAWLRAAITQA